jgi:NADH:ubiquinone oxidoreductase subunit E
MGETGVARNNVPQNLLIALKEAQDRYGYLSREFMAELAESLGVPVNDVYGVATFYSFLSPEPLGRHVIRICRSLPCHLKSAEIVIGTIAAELGIEPGQTTPDNRFSFELVNCIGLCDGAPAMLVDEDAHVNLTPEKIKGILQAYK